MKSCYVLGNKALQTNQMAKTKNKEEKRKKGSRVTKENE
jgi:hypothetical protein